jgi:hypothetical protein
MTQLILKSPLFTDWSEQYIKIAVPGVEPGTAFKLDVNGVAVDFQYTGEIISDGAEIMLCLGFSKGETKTLTFTPCINKTTDLTRVELPLSDNTVIGLPGRELQVSATMPFAGFAGWKMNSRIVCDAVFEGVNLLQINDGPLFTDYELDYRYADHRFYTLNFRCYKNDSYIEVAERFGLQMGSKLVWTINPDNNFTHIISRDSFEGDNQPTIEPLGEEHPRDVLCRLQMPVLTEYFIPNNRGWFSFFNQDDASQDMFGILGLYGAKWQQPVENMPELLDCKGTIEWNASLESGIRYWLIYTGAVETGFTPEHRLTFHRLHAEFNALRLDEHLDLTGEAEYDVSVAGVPGMFEAGDYHADAKKRLATFPALQAVLPDPNDWLKENGSMHIACFSYLLDPNADNTAKLYDQLIARFERWVFQFQGYRTEQNDYMKNVIGFSRFLRGMLIGYEQLRRDDVLTNEQIGKLNAYFVFAARRIKDEGRWPHSRTAIHPDHPESTRDLYTYGGEHKPDRLYWTNSLPNFQGDPMCALAQLSAIFPDHPDSSEWQRFALDDIENQLNAYCGKSGAWEESINYALYTFSYFVITFRALKNRCGIDYFNDERVRRYASWLCRFLGPKDKRWNKYTYPGVGNAVCPTGGGEYLLCYAAELAIDDPLRADCLAVWQRLEANCSLGEHYPSVMAAMAPIVTKQFPLRVLGSENMDEVGVAMRDKHTQPDESYLFQKIGFAKDHYEADETAFNWYAKGTPLCMDYGTYTGEVGVGNAHNIIDIPELDPLRRGYLADHMFTNALDYTRCEMPVILKLLWGRVRSFDEVDNVKGSDTWLKAPYFYIGDHNPIGPKCWKVRQILFVKPDYMVIFDRVYGDIPHRYCLHVTGENLQREGQLLSADGRFDLDLKVFVQHPTEFEMQTGELIPNLHPGCGGDENRKNHAQKWFRLYNHTDGIYRTLLFAQERGRDVQIEAIGDAGIKVITPEYTDYVFLHNSMVYQPEFTGRAGWIRQYKDGKIESVVPDGESITAFGKTITGRGPWHYNLDGKENAVAEGPLPRKIIVKG